MAVPLQAPDLFVIADGVDPLAARFADFARAAGRSVEHLSYAEAALRFSIRRSDARTCVSPTVPLLLRLPLAPPAWATGETHFHRAEICSLVWGAAALTEAPVVNRPDAFGFASRSAWSINVVRSRAGMALHEPEVVASHAPQPLGPDDEWWLERQADGAIFPWVNRRASGGPYRASRVRPDFTLHNIIVAGGQAWGDLPADITIDLRVKSVQICAALNITFATVTWRWHAADNTGVFARLNPYPTLAEIDSFWMDVGDQLLLELSR